MPNTALSNTTEPPIDDIPYDGDSGGDNDRVRFAVFLPRSVLPGLEKVRELTGKSSIAEVIQTSVELYRYICQEGGSTGFRSEEEEL